MGARFRSAEPASSRRLQRRREGDHRAMQHYGMIVADNGSDWYFQGAADPHVDRRPDG